MRLSIDLNEPTAVEAAGGVLRFEPPDRLVVIGVTRSSSLRVPGLCLSDWMEGWCGRDWCCLIGWQDRTVVVALPAMGEVEAIGDLDRLDLSGSYDPGGLYYVEFIELPCGDQLLVHELGLARISPRNGIRWQASHDCLGVRFESVEGGVVRLSCDDGRYAYRLEDGRATVP